MAVEPGLPSFEDVGTLLLRRMRGLFLKVRPCRSRKVQTEVIPIVTPRSLARRSAISASEMSSTPASLDKPQDESRVWIEPRAAGLALTPGHRLAALPIAPHPNDGRRDADAEPLGRLPRRHSVRRGLDHPRAQIRAAGLDHRRLRITGDDEIRLLPVRESHPQVDARRNRSGA